MKVSILLIAIIFVGTLYAEAIEPAAEAFIVQDIEYQSFDDAASLKIETNSHIDYVIYELEDPYRIVIDPLDTVFCDFEEAVYFDEGLVKSIKFVKGKDVKEGPGHPYYPFDFVAVELRRVFPYNLAEEEYILTLNIGDKKPAIERPKTEPRPEDLDAARTIEEEIVKGIEAPPAKKPEIVEQKIVEQKEERFEEPQKVVEDTLLKEKRELSLAKEELEKKRTSVKKEKTKLVKEKVRLEKEREKLKKAEKELETKKKAFKYEPRPTKEFLEKPLPDNYLGKILTLDDCIQIAMSNNLAVKTAKERVKLAKLKVNEAFRELFPEFSLLWDESRGMISNEHYVGRKFGMEFKQVIFHGGEQMYLWEQTKTNMKVTEENLNKAKEELIFNVTKAYYDLAKAENKHNFHKALLEDINANFETAKKELEFGLISQIDFMNIASVIDQASHTLLSYENTFSLSKLALNKAMNIGMDTDIKIASNIGLKELDIDLDNCVELALKFRPEYRISHLNTEVAKLTERIAKSQTFPQIDIFAKYLKARELREPTFESLDNRLKNERVLGATVSVPWGPHTIDYQKKIVKLAPTVTTFESNTKSDTDRFRLNLFDNMARESTVADASIKYRESLDELNKAEQSIHTDIHEALYSFKEAALKLKNTVNNIELYDKELKVAEVRKGLNETSFLELIQAKIRLYTERGVYTDAVGDYNIAIARVNKAIGLGGYFK